jgi:hypothetical protein
MQRHFIQRVADHFKNNPGQWIDGRDLEVVGGRYAWRSRVSDCRTRLGMIIENRQRHVKGQDGTRYTISEYRYRPQESLGRDAGERGQARAI